MLNHFLNALASRLGVVLCIATLIAATVGGVGYVRNGLEEIRLGRALFEAPRLREGVVALSDIYRLNLLVKEALSEGEVSDVRRGEIRRAIDILFVRWRSFGRLIGTDAAVAQAYTAHEAISRIIELSDAAAKAGFSDLAGFAGSLFQASEKARASLVLYMDELQRQQAHGLTRQASTLFSLTVMLAIYLITVCAVGVATILLLRREVIGRVKREQAERKADFLAYFDPMTGLPNRVQFQENLSSRIAEETEFSLIFVDLDDFKGINDSHGHAAGDIVLREVGSRLQARARSYGGMAARLAGDEFAAILPTENAGKLRFFARELLEDCERPIIGDGASFQVGLSLGIAARGTVRQGGNASDEDMARAADYALYEAKSAGRRTYRIYDRLLETRHAARRQLLDAIPKALADREFQVAYQPKVILETREVYGYEALVRWQRRSGFVPPGQFLPLAEESRRILEIDAFVLESATRQIARWNTQFDPPRSVSVNLSALHFEDTAIIGMVERALERTGLAPSLLTLEMTETVLLEDWRNVQAILGALRSIGVSISLDDFGTGYSSLAYLRRIAANELKIDRSFVSEIEQSQETRFILDAVIDIAKSLGMSIVVEGIETEVQSAIVQSFGCDRGQGFLFGKPVLAEEISSELNHREERRRSA